MHAFFFLGFGRIAPGSDIKTGMNLQCSCDLVDVLIAKGFKCISRPTFPLRSLKLGLPVIRLRCRQFNAIRDWFYPAKIEQSVLVNDAIVYSFFSRSYGTKLITNPATSNSLSRLVKVPPEVDNFN